MKINKINSLVGVSNILCFLFLLTILKVNSQSPTLKFIHYSTKDGLPSSQIYQAFQDSRGYLWFTTDHGLVKYNGYEFKVFSTEDGLTDNTVFKIFEDHKKRLWLLTFSGGISIYENQKIKPYKYNSLAKAEIKGSVPMGIYVDSSENVFVTCHQWGEFRVDNKGKVFHEFVFSPDTNIHKVYIHEHDKKNFLISICSYDDIERPLRLYYRKGHTLESAEIDLVKQRRAYCIRLHDNRMLVGISNKLVAYKNQTAELIASLPADIIYLFEDSRNRLWIGTTNGIYLYNDANNFKNFNIYLQKNFVSSIMEDKEGGFWITTINNGIFYLANDQIKNYVFDNESLNEPLVVTSDGKSSIYAGYWSGDVAKFNNQNLEDIYTSSQRNLITCLYYDSTTTKLYVGSRISGYILKGEFRPFNKLNIPSIPLDLIKSQNGFIYGGGDRVLYKIKEDSIVQIGSFTIRVNCVYQISESEFLLGCNSGAYLFNEQERNIKLYCDELKDVRIDDIELFKNHLCFATRGKGLLLKQKDSFKWINQSNGLASNLVHKIIADADNLWCATNNGVSQITFSNINYFQFRINNVNIKDGLSSNEIHDITILNDTLFAATSEGISLFSTHHNFINQVLPAVYFTSLRVNNIDTTPSGYCKFPHNFNNIRIGFEAPTFKSIGDIRYHYLLTEDDDSIINTTQSREAEFLALNPGNYVFTVFAVNGTREINSQPKVLKFTILKPFWQQWWFRAVIALCLAIILYCLMTRHINRIRKEEEIKTAFNKQLVQFEMKALRAQMNPHFIFNVINSIQDYILKNDARSAQKYLTKFARLVRLILDNSVKSEVVLQEELKAAELYIELEQQRFENKFEFILHVDENVDTTQVILPAMIIQPYLENAIKHGIRHLSSPGKLILNVTQENTYINIIIEDNGVGRAASAEKNKTNVREHVSYGIIITAKRMEAYNVAYNSDISSTVTDLTDENGIPAGTRIVVRIPVKYKQSIAE